MPTSEMSSCPACGCPMAAGARKCPSCRWSPEKERERSREFWWALVVFGGVFFATALAVYIVAARLHIG